MKSLWATSTSGGGQADWTVLCTLVLLSSQRIAEADIPRTLHPGTSGKIELVPGRNLGNEERIRAEGFVKRTGNRLEVAGRPYFISGFNNYALVTRSADPMPGRYTRHADVEGTLMTAQRLGLNALRTWAFADGDVWNALQPQLGVFDERTFTQGLDYMVAIAPRYGLRLILTLTNFPPGYGGMEQYVRWFNGTSILDFYTNPAIVKAFKEYVKFVLTRVNALTGIPYAEDPAILAWDLCNEPQAPGDDTGDILQAWIEDMAAYIKELDPNHLLTVGMHGFFGLSTPSLMRTNPSDVNVFSSVSSGNIFAANPVCRGEDFARIFSIPQLDFSSMHMYPDFVTLCTKDCQADTADMYVGDVQLTLTELGTWVLCSPGCQAKIARNWLQVHIDKATVLGKPLFLGEFGAQRPVWRRNAIYSTFYNSLYKAAAAGWAVAGSAMWMLQAATMDDYDGFAVYADPGMYGRNLSWQPYKPPVFDCQVNSGAAQRFRNHDEYIKCALKYVPNALPENSSHVFDPWHDGWNQTLDIMRNSSAAFAALGYRLSNSSTPLVNLGG
eukprot:jgi/Botrbrau1/8805/Bobra.0330s0035.1